MTESEPSDEAFVIVEPDDDEEQVTDFVLVDDDEPAVETGLVVVDDAADRYPGLVAVEPDAGFRLLDDEEEETGFVIVDEDDDGGVDIVSVDDPDRRFPGIDRVYQRPSK